MIDIGLFICMSLGYRLTLENLLVLFVFRPLLLIQYLS